MTAEIRIRFDGAAPGLGAGRLSLAAFLPALTNLLHAYRRIGSNMIVAAEDPEHGVKGGRLAKAATALDLEIGAIHHNCLVIEAVPTSQPIAGEHPTLFNELPRIAGERLLEDIDAESKGLSRNGLVRKYLREMPPGVTKQTYTLREGGRELRTVEVTEVAVVNDDVTLLPTLREFTALPTGVVFASERPMVKLSAEGEGLSSWYLGSAKHVDTVLAHRGAPVRVLAMFGAVSTPRILRMRVGADSLAPASPETINRRIFTDWRKALELLA